MNLLRPVPVVLRSHVKGLTQKCFLKHKSTEAKKEELQEKIKMKTPIGKLDELESGKHPFQEKEPLREWPEGRNPQTGEQHGPKGPEPTRYGDWERKGRVTDF